MVADWLPESSEVSFGVAKRVQLHTPHTALRRSVMSCDSGSMPGRVAAAQLGLPRPRLDVHDSIPAGMPAGCSSRPTARSCGRSRRTSSRRALARPAETAAYRRVCAGGFGVSMCLLAG
jgi:hypothetical protein